MLDVFGIERSLSGKECPYDNAVDEPANKIPKAELVYREAFGTTRELWVKPTDYVHWYNNFRMHSTLGYMTPVEFRKAGLVLPRIAQKDVANPYSSRGDWNMPWPGPIHKDSTHNAVRHGCCLGCHARMLHVFLLFPLALNIRSCNALRYTVYFLDYPNLCSYQTSDTQMVLRRDYFKFISGRPGTILLAFAYAIAFPTEVVRALFGISCHQCSIVLR